MVKTAGVMALLAAGATLGACVNSQTSDYLYACGTGGACPANYLCAGDDLCHPQYIPDASTNDAGEFGCSATAPCPGTELCSDAGLCVGTGGGGGLSCAAPPDAGWPVNCGTEKPLLEIGTLPSNSSPLWGITAIPQSGGYLVGILESQFGVAQFLFVSADGTVVDAGYQACENGNGDDCPAYAISLIPNGSGRPLLAAGYTPPTTSGNFTDEMAFWAPYGGTVPQPVDLESVGPNQMDVAVDELVATSSDGQVAALVANVSGGAGLDVLLLGSDAGALPTQNSASILHSTNVLGIAIAPSEVSGAPFVLGEELSGSPSALEVSLLGGGSVNVPIGTFSSATTYFPPPAVTADGTSFTAVASSDQLGTQLFTGALPAMTLILDGGVVLAPPPSFGVSAASCGSGCALVGVLAGVSVGADAGLEETPTFDFVSPEGCGTQVKMAGFSDDVGETAFTAVAAQAGGALLLYGSTFALAGSQGYGGRVNMRLCAP